MNCPTCAFLASIVLPIVLAFSPKGSSGWSIGDAISGAAGRRISVLTSTRLRLSSEGEQQVHPALSRSEVESFLSSVPVYGVVSKENGAMLIFEEEGRNVAKFFISKEMAEMTLGRLGDERDAEVEGYYLGLIWKSVLFPDESKELEGEQSVKILATNDEDIEYRLVPDSREVKQAQELYSQSRHTPDGGDMPFSGPNEVPVFMDLTLRLETERDEGNYEETFPMFLSYRDLLSTCQEYAKDQDGENIQAAISVGELTALVRSMGAESRVDFREAALIPPSPLPFQ